jgi:hypothetical protein
MTDDKEPLAKAHLMLLKAWRAPDPQHFRNILFILHCLTERLPDVPRKRIPEQNPERLP